MDTKFANLGYVNSDGTGRYISIAMDGEPFEFGNVLIEDFSDIEDVRWLVSARQGDLGRLNGMVFLERDAEVINPQSYVGGIQVFFTKDVQYDFAYCWTPSGWLFRIEDRVKPMKKILSF